MEWRYDHLIELIWLPNSNSDSEMPPLSHAGQDSVGDGEGDGEGDESVILHI